MLPNRPGAVLFGWRRESEVLDNLLETVRGGQSEVLVVLGEAGICKTALLDHAISSAAGFRVARAVGVQWEMELPLAGLEQLCAPLLDRLERLPGPQRDALGVAFGLGAGTRRTGSSSGWRCRVRPSCVPALRARRPGQRRRIWGRCPPAALTPRSDSR
jgi:hypothetical protein